MGIATAIEERSLAQAEARSLQAGTPGPRAADSGVRGLPRHQSRRQNLQMQPGVPPLMTAEIARLARTLPVPAPAAVWNAHSGARLHDALLDVAGGAARRTLPAPSQLRRPVRLSHASQGRVMAPQIRIGTSGWQYADWRDVLYPKGVPQRAWLQRYAEVFDTVELNSSFYRLPSAVNFERWKRGGASRISLRGEVEPLPHAHSRAA